MLASFGERSMNASIISMAETELLEDWSGADSPDIEPAPGDEGEVAGLDDGSGLYCTYVDDWDGGEGLRDDAGYADEGIACEMSYATDFIACGAVAQVALVGIALCLANPHDQLLC